MIEEQQRKAQEQGTAMRRAFKTRINYLALGVLVIGVVIVAVALL